MLCFSFVQKKHDNTCDKVGKNLMKNIMTITLMRIKDLECVQYRDKMHLNQSKFTKYNPSRFDVPVFLFWHAKILGEVGG